jgi:hypothetical protein
MRHRTPIALFAGAAAVAALALGVMTSSAGSMAISRWVMGGGAQSATGGGLRLQSTLGQPAIGLESSGPLTLSWGYWHPAVSADETATPGGSATATGLPTATPDGTMPATLVSTETPVPSKTPWPTKTPEGSSTWVPSKTPDGTVPPSATFTPDLTATAKASVTPGQTMVPATATGAPSTATAEVWTKNYLPMALQRHDLASGVFDRTHN